MELLDWGAGVVGSLTLYFISWDYFGKKGYPKYSTNVPIFKNTRRLIYKYIAGGRDIKNRYTYNPEAYRVWIPCL